MFTEEQLLKLLKVQSNLTPKDFKKLFPDLPHELLFRNFAMNNWNLLDFLFNKINGENREVLINYINKQIKTNK